MRRNDFPFGGRHSWLRRPILFGAILIASIHLLHGEDGPVAAVQEALKKRQFYDGEVTGKLDEPTRAGVQRFQIHVGIPDTGELDAPTLQALQGDRLPPAKESQPVRTADADAQPGAQSDREFLEQVEKKENGVALPAPPATRGEVRSTAQESATGEQNADSKGPQETPHPRVVEKHVKAATAEKRGVSRKEKRSLEPILDGAAEAQGMRKRALPPTQRESPVQPTLAAPPGNASETALRRGSKVTKVTTTFTGPDGRIYTYEKTTTTVPNTSKPFLRPFFGANN